MAPEYFSPAVGLSKHYKENKMMDRPYFAPVMMTEEEYQRERALELKARQKAIEAEKDQA